MKTSEENHAAIAEGQAIARATSRRLVSVTTWGAQARLTLAEDNARVSPDELWTVEEISNGYFARFATRKPAELECPASGQSLRFIGPGEGFSCPTCGQWAQARRVAWTGEVVITSHYLPEPILDRGKRYEISPRSTCRECGGDAVLDADGTVYECRKCGVSRFTEAAAIARILSKL